MFEIRILMRIVEESPDRCLDSSRPYSCKIKLVVCIKKIGRSFKWASLVAHLAEYKDAGSDPIMFNSKFTCKQAHLDISIPFIRPTLDTPTVYSTYIG